MLRYRANGSLWQAGRRGQCRGSADANGVQELVHPNIHLLREIFSFVMIVGFGKASYQPPHPDPQVAKGILKPSFRLVLTINRRKSGENCPGPPKNVAM